MADTVDSKSTPRKGVRVRAPPWAPFWERGGMADAGDLKSLVLTDVRVQVPPLPPTIFLPAWWNFGRHARFRIWCPSGVRVRVPLLVPSMAPYGQPLVACACGAGSRPAAPTT